MKGWCQGGNHGNWISAFNPTVVWHRLHHSEFSPEWHSAPCCVSFHGLHSHKCFLPSLKPFSATLLLIYVLCVLNICLPVCFWCPRFTIWHRSSHCCLVDVYKCISFSSFSGTASVAGCLRTVTSPSCLLSECIHVGTWQSSIDYCCFVPNWCF